MTGWRGYSANDPMLRGGLALAGAQQTLEHWDKGEPVSAENDGFLTAEEIGLLDLQDTWLVVLSGCDTGIGEAKSGEGVLGLRRGFVQAGAQNIFMTLWPILDAGTARFITDFYSEACKTGDAPGALSSVQRAWLSRLRNQRGISDASRIAGPFILSFQGCPIGNAGRPTSQNP
jgi:CHAT domain-containing protein